MNQPIVKPVIKISGSANQNHRLNSTRPIAFIKSKDRVNVVKLSQWCAGNFITPYIGYRLIRLKYLLAFRRHHTWYVAANPACKDELLNYLGLEALFYDADNSV